MSNFLPRELKGSKADRGILKLNVSTSKCPKGAWVKVTVVYTSVHPSFPGFDSNAVEIQSVSLDRSRVIKKRRNQISVCL